MAKSTAKKNSKSAADKKAEAMECINNLTKLHELQGNVLKKLKKSL